MSSRGGVVLGLFALCLVGALVSGRAFFYNLAYVWGGLFAISLLWSRLSLAGVSVERQILTERAMVGELFEERFRLVNDSRWAKLWIEIRDLTELPGIRANLLTGLGFISEVDAVGHSGSAVLTGIRRGGSERWQVRTICTRRGRFPLGPTELRGGDPFGLFPIRRRDPIYRHLVVLPAVVPIRSFPIPSGRLPGGEALRRRTHQVTPNASGVREYEPGDSLNRIHWKSTAKRDRLISKEFEFDPLADVWLVLDMAARAQFEREGEAFTLEANGKQKSLWEDPRKRIPQATEEYAVSIAASLAFHLMERDRDVGLIAHARSRHVVQPERGEAQLHRLLEALAVLQAEGGHSVREVLKIESDRIPRGATVILVTADVSTEIVATARDLLRLGRVPIVILLDAESFNGPPGSGSLLSALRKAGAQAYLIVCGDDLESALNIERAQPQPAFQTT